jgi:DNA-binding MarR family transcriptional regulator
MQEYTESDLRVAASRDELPAQTGGAPGDGAFVIEESVGYLVNYLARAFARAHAERLAGHGATLGQWAVLVFLWERDGQSQGELSRSVAIEDATMVRTIDRMERDGLVRRVRDARDRRRVNVFLTDKGRALRDPLVPCAVATNEAATRPFTEAEKRQLSDFLRRMIGALEDDQSTRKKGDDRVRTEGVE